MTREQWMELDGKSLSISVMDPGPTTTRVLGEDEEGNLYILKEFENAPSTQPAAPVL